MASPGLTRTGAPAARSAEAPERWQADAGDRPVARLDVPPHATRERIFELDVQLLVGGASSGGAGATHALRVLVNGQQEWSRRVATAEGAEDSLEWRQQRRVPVGEPLRVQAHAEVRGTRRRRLTVLAHEEALPGPAPADR